MSIRKPLDGRDKWIVCQYWIKQKPPLTRSAMLVLLRLLDRQNTKTRRCDPSEIGLSQELGYDPRTIRMATRELSNRGAVHKYRQPGRTRNQYLIYRPDEIGHGEHSSSQARFDRREINRTGRSMRPEHREQNSRNWIPSETKKETKKKKTHSLQNGADHAHSSLSGRPVMDLADFEKRMVKVFEKKGWGYAGLLSLSPAFIEETHQKLLRGALSFNQAVTALLNAYAELADE